MAVGPTIFYFDPVGRVDGEDALRKLGIQLHMGLTYPISNHLNQRTIGRLGFTSTNVEQFPLSLPRGVSVRSLHAYLGIGLFYRLQLD